MLPAQKSSFAEGNPTPRIAGTELSVIYLETSINRLNPLVVQVSS
jgi:hypothetical protein